VRVVYLIQWD